MTINELKNNRWLMFTICLVIMPFCILGCLLMALLCLTLPLIALINPKLIKIKGI